MIRFMIMAYICNSSKGVTACEIARGLNRILEKPTRVYTPATVRTVLNRMLENGDVRSQLNENETTRGRLTHIEWFLTDKGNHEYESLLHDLVRVTSQR